MRPQNKKNEQINKNEFMEFKSIKKGSMQKSREAQEIQRMIMDSSYD